MVPDTARAAGYAAELGVRAGLDGALRDHGIAAWLVWKRRRHAALRLWGWQLAANALWAPAFFGLHSPALAMGVMVAMLVLIAVTIGGFRPVQKARRRR